MKELIISDTHFGHANIIRYCDRPFTSTDEMDATMISRWNEVVAPDQTVYHLGDFAFGPIERVKEIRDQLSGRIHLIIGNHDRYPKRKYLDAGFESAQDSLRIRVHNGWALLRHRPPIQSDRWPPGVRMQLVGHIHDKPGWWEAAGTDLRIYNCSVELLDYRPVTLEQLLAIHQKRRRAREAGHPVARPATMMIPALNQGVYLPR